MKTQLWMMSLAIIFSLSAQAQGQGQTRTLENKTVEYTDKDTTFQGYFIAPKGMKKGTPGILMIHNWKGITDETKKQAERFAKLGYAVFAADIYGKGVRPTDPKQAGALSGKYKSDRDLLRERLASGLQQLKKMGIDGSKTAVIGYCFGGTAALELARAGADVDGVVSFHGGLDSPNPADGKNIKAKVLAFHGAIDPYVPPADLAAFEEEMKTNKVDYQLIKYGGAVHSFTEKSAGTDPSKGAAYHEPSDRRSFIAAQDFLSEIFKISYKH